MVVLRPPPGGLACASSATTAASRRSFTSSITAHQIPLVLASGNGPNDRLPGKSELLFRPPSWLRRALPFPHTNLPVTGFGGSRQTGFGGVGTGRGYAVLAAAAPGDAFVKTTRPREPPRICILGGGFGGLYTAVRLNSLMWPNGTKPQVTVIDQNDRFVFKPMLYELLSDTVQPWEVAPRFDKLLAPYKARFIQGQVSAVEPNNTVSPSSAGRVLLKDGEPIEYDWLVLAIGSDATPRKVPGAKELAIPFVTFDDAMKVRSHLEVLQRGTNACVTVVGAGYAGVELAIAVAERLGVAGNVRLVTPGPDIMPGSDAGQRASAHRALSQLGVTVMSDTVVVSLQQGEQEAGRPLTKRRVKLRKGGSSKEIVMEADLVLWTAGAVPLTADDNANSETFRPKPKFGMPFPRNARGATETDLTLRVVNNSHVFALGDTSDMKMPEMAAGMEEHLPQTAQVAFQQADYVAWNLWASINNRPLLPFRYQHLGSMMSLGKAAGAVALPVGLPPPLSNSMANSQLGELLGRLGVQVGASGVTLDGPLGGLVRRAAYWYRQPTDDHRARVGISWAAQAAKDAADMVGTASITSLLSALQNGGGRK